MTARKSKHLELSFAFATKLPPRLFLGSYEATPEPVGPGESITIEILSRRYPNPYHCSCLVCRQAEAAEPPPPEYLYYTPAKRGPFCRVCIERLGGLDQILILEARLGQAESKIKDLQKQVEHLGMGFFDLV